MLLSFVISPVCSGQAPGSIDPTFTTMPGPSFGNALCMAVQPDAKIIMGGSFTAFNNESYSYLARANADGTHDTTFNTSMALDGGVNAVILLEDNKILICGGFTSYNGVSRNHIARLNNDGSLDASFDPGTGSSYIITCMVRQPDGKIVIGGLFTSYNGVERNRIARLNADGSLDTTFNPGTGFNESPYDIVLQPDGKLLIGGLFTTFNDLERNGIVRLNANGSLDTTFNTGSGGMGILSVVLQPDNKILVGGFFTTFNGVDRKRIARLNSNGSVDTTFNPGTGASHIIYNVALLPDGKILTGGQFVTFNGVSENYLTSLNADGSADTTFDFGTGPNGWIQAILPQPNGKIYILGEFWTFNQQSYNSIVRLNGSCDTPAPTGPSTQVIPENSQGSATVGDLEATGTNIHWYNAQGNLVANDTPLTNGATYYATQTVGSCESSFLVVVVEFALGLKTFAGTTINFYPNPVKDNLNITSDRDITLVEVYTVTGQKILSKAMHGSQGSLDMSMLASASYLVKVLSENAEKNLLVVKM